MSDRKAIQARYRAKNKEKMLQYAKEYRRQVKKEALDRYGTFCAVCGFTDIRALQIDHIENNGNIERNSLGGQKNAGWGFYVYLRQNGWPDGYQTLCANHNMIKHLGDDFYLTEIVPNDTIKE